MDPKTTTSSNTHAETETLLEERLTHLEGQEIEEHIQEQAKAQSLVYADLHTYPVDANAILLLSEQDARTGQIAIIHKAGQRLTVAVKDARNEQTRYVLEQLKNRGFECELVMVSGSSLEIAWRQYDHKQEIKRDNPGILDLKASHAVDLGTLKKNIATLPVTEIMEIILAAALENQSSDIHFEPEETTIRLRFRLDGVLQDIVTLEKQTYPSVLSRVKVISGLKLNIHEAPQDGRFTIRYDNKDIEVRVSILPGAYGENIVARILNPDSINHKLETLGMRGDVLKNIQEILKKTTGAFLTTGPTGSGKTTTLYACLEEVNDPGVKIITIEDPIEYHIQGISQTQVDEQAGYTFADGLRSIMRQDPDTILVGEIRDGETAEIAMQAALTGHFVFSTLHTNDAAGAIPRLIDLGVRPVTIAPAIKAIMAQRLVRRLCEHCKKIDTIKTEDKEFILKNLINVPDSLKPKDLDQLNTLPYAGEGCEQCGNTGYKGRVGVYELFEIDADVEKLILASPAISEVRALIVQKGMVPMLQDGILKVLAGMTSIEEVIRVVGT